MADGGARRHVVVLASTWEGGTEWAFALRQIAGALSRTATVDVLVSGPVGPAVGDGLFDLIPLGEAAPGRRWPPASGARWPVELAPDLVLVDRFTEEVAVLVEPLASDPAIVALTSNVAANERREPGGPDAVVVVGPPVEDGGGPGGTGVHDVGLHVPVHPLAAARRHNGFGFTDYTLVLTDRAPSADRRPTPSSTDRGPAGLPEAAAWLAAGLPDRDLIVVQDGLAAAWWGRALRGVVSIDTRTDLWRLMAHARVTVDLAPGDLLARECVESARYGTPVVVPAGTTAARTAALGGGLWYRDMAELLGCVDALDDRQLRDTLGQQARELADARYGDPFAFADRVGSMLNAVLGGRVSSR